MADSKKPRVYLAAWGDGWEGFETFAVCSTAEKAIEEAYQHSEQGELEWGSTRRLKDHYELIEAEVDGDVLRKARYNEKKARWVWRQHGTAR